LVAHDRSTASFLVFLHLWSRTEAGTVEVATSYETMATSTGLSKRTVQKAVGHLERRGLIAVRRAYATAVPQYRVRTPWTRKRTAVRRAGA
jgi:DNA-binding transcriptional MocR family regulator